MDRRINIIERKKRYELKELFSSFTYKMSNSNKVKREESNPPRLIRKEVE